MSKECLKHHFLTLKKIESDRGEDTVTEES